MYICKLVFFDRVSFKVEQNCLEFGNLLLEFILYLSLDRLRVAHLDKLQNFVLSFPYKLVHNLLNFELGCNARTCA